MTGVDHEAQALQSSARITAVVSVLYCCCTSNQVSNSRLNSDILEWIIQILRLFSLRIVKNHFRYLPDRATANPVEDSRMLHAARSIERSNAISILPFGYTAGGGRRQTAAWSTVDIPAMFRNSGWPTLSRMAIWAAWRCMDRTDVHRQTAKNCLALADRNCRQQLAFSVAQLRSVLVPTGGLRTRTTPTMCLKMLARTRRGPKSRRRRTRCVARASLTPVA